VRVGGRKGYLGFSGGEGGFYKGEVRVSEVIIGGDVGFFVQMVVNETALI
jgi:hypothetical protein